MEIQVSLFESAQKEQGSVPICKKIGPRPMGWESSGYTPKNFTEVQYKEGVACIETPQTLIGEPKKIRMTISDVANKMMELASSGKLVYSFRIK